jgi:hypothetical protein
LIPGVWRLLPLVALLLLPACATRSPDPGGAAAHANLLDNSAARLLSVWQQNLLRYIDLRGGGDVAVLLALRERHSRDTPRPGRIVFGVLDVDASLPGRDGWDVHGVLVGKHAERDRNWYVFLVGIVRRSDYRPREVQDVRLVALASFDGKVVWRTDDRTPDAVRRYREAFAGEATIRFPAETDQFRLTGAGRRISVREVQSGALWSLQLRLRGGVDG